MSVDMAKMKSEFLSHYYKKFTMGIKDKIISDMPKLIWLLKIVSPIFNKVKNIPLLDKLIELSGFSTKREMPEVLSITPLKEIYNTQPKSQNKIILLADTFNINFEIKNRPINQINLFIFFKLTIVIRG